MVLYSSDQNAIGNMETYREIESYLRAPLLHVCEKAGFLIGAEFVGESGSRNKGEQIR